MLRGGVIQKPELTNSINTRSNFVKFLENSSISLWSNNSSYGIILLCELTNADFTSPYYSFRSLNFGKEIRKVILKLSPLVNKHEKRPILMIGSREKKRTIVSEFIAEYQNQLHIALSSSKYLESLAPYPIFLDTFTSNESYDNYFEDIYTISDDSSIYSDDKSKGSILFDDKEFLDLLERNFVSNVADNEDDDDIDDKLIEDEDIFKGGNSSNIITIIKDKLLNNQFDSLGLLAMEFGDGFNTLFSFKNMPSYKLYKNMARYSLIEMFIVTGISHNDIHQENILFNPNYKGYYFSVEGKALTIDFGLVKTISYDHYINAKNYFDKNDFFQLIKYIYDVSIVQNGIENDRYSWFAEIDDVDVNTLSNLKNLRTHAVADIEKSSIQLNNNTPITSDNIFSVYPLLPLKMERYLKYLPRKENKIFITKGGSKDENMYMPKNISFSSLFMKIIITIANSFINLTQCEKKIGENKITKNKMQKISNVIETNYLQSIPIKAGKRVNKKSKRKRSILKKYIKNKSRRK